MKRPLPTDRETEWSKWLAYKMNGKAEARTFCGTRCDVLTDTHAWEVEWMKKYNQAPGQALLYASLFNKKPGIILLSKNDERDSIYYLRCAEVFEKAGIDLQDVDTFDEVQDRVGIADVIKNGWSKIIGGK